MTLNPAYLLLLLQDVAFGSPEKIAGKSICIDIATIIDDCQSNHYLGPWPAMPQHRKCSEYINFCSTSSVFNSLNTVITTKRCEKSCNVNITLVPQLLKEQYFYTSLNLSVILSYVRVQCLDFVTRIRSLYPNVFLYPFEVKYHTHTHTHTHLSLPQPTVKLFIDGQMVESKADRWIDNYNPATQEVVSRVPCATQDEMNAAVAAAKRAFPAWRERSVMARQNVMFQLRQLIKENMVSGGFN